MQYPWIFLSIHRVRPHHRSALPEVCKSSDVMGNLQMVMSNHTTVKCNIAFLIEFGRLYFILFGLHISLIYFPTVIKISLGTLSSPGHSQLTPMAPGPEAQAQKREVCVAGI